MTYGLRARWFSMGPNGHAPILEVDECSVAYMTQVGTFRTPGTQINNVVRDEAGARCMKRPRQQGAGVSNLAIVAQNT
jgi:hypothetical protein